MQRALTSVGIFVVLYSLYLAIAETYNHFYEVTLLGLLLVLFPFVYRKLNFGLMLKLYVAFLSVAAFGDLFIVLGFTHLWHYSFTSVWEYASLYLFIYPAGGFVMLASYLIAKDYFSLEKRRVHISQSLLWISSALVYVSIPLELYFINAFAPAIWSLAFTGTMALAVGLPAIAFSERLYRKSFVRDLISDPRGCLSAITIATYPNLLLHEYPNIYAQEWIYTIGTGTAAEVFILGIPLLIWISWPILTIVPVSFYYLLAGKDW